MGKFFWTSVTLGRSTDFAAAPAIGRESLSGRRWPNGWPGSRVPLRQPAAFDWVYPSSVTPITAPAARICDSMGSAERRRVCAFWP